MDKGKEREVLSGILKGNEDAFDEFYEEALVPLREKFIGLSEDEREKDRLANEWYENNVQR